jgi:nicotinamide-nucleotide amidase
MQAEIIAIGSELTSGAKLDTNSQWLSHQLASVGVQVHFHSTVADSVGNLVALMNSAVERSDLVLITGGLGPTLDDLTRDAMARLIGVELEFDQPSLDHLEDMFVKRGRSMPERNRIQAMFPTGSRPIENHCGTAPGIRMEVERNGRPPCILAAFPGVPSEMKPMFVDNIMSRLTGTGRVIRHACIHCFGSGESHIEELLGDLTARGHDPEVGITAHDATITMRIMASGASVAECESKIARARQTIYERLGNLVFGEEDVELQHVLVGQLIALGKTVCCVEDATTGLLARWIASVDDADTVFVGGLVVSARRMAAVLTASDSDGIRQIAANCCALFAADYAIAIGPLTNSMDADVPAIAYSIVGNDLEFETSLPLTGNPAIMKSRTAKAAINTLRLHLETAAQRP